LSNNEIARELQIGEATVKTRLLRAFAKLGVSDRTAAVTTAMAAGLLPPPDHPGSGSPRMRPPRVRVMSLSVAGDTRRGAIISR